ncbi:MAG: helix-turn-helix domain-containing protein [Defluviitaleaceae bacterium]|nr:helix-turn-helix domain-containing protein [Defluviitaleaceae bacterium]
MAIGEKIQSLRTKSGYSQEALANLLGVTRQSVSKWELGQALPDTEKIIQLSRLFEVTTDSLLINNDPPPEAQKQALYFGMYLIVKDFAKSINFYEKLLCMQAFTIGKNRFAQFFINGTCMAIMNEAHLPNHDYTGTGDHKFVLNFWIPNLSAEHQRVKSLNIGLTTNIIQAHSNYYFFQVYDPDNNVIEITGKYTECRKHLPTTS